MNIKVHNSVVCNTVSYSLTSANLYELLVPNTWRSWCAYIFGGYHDSVPSALRQDVRPQYVHAPYIRYT